MSNIYPGLSSITMMNDFLPIPNVVSGSGILGLLPLPDTEDFLAHFYVFHSPTCIHCQKFLPVINEAVINLKNYFIRKHRCFRTKYRSSNVS